MNMGMTRTRFVRKAMARSNGTWAGHALRPAASETSTTVMTPPTSVNAASRWNNSSQFQSVGRMAAIIRTRLEDHQDEDRDQRGEAQVAEQRRLRSPTARCSSLARAVAVGSETFWPARGRGAVACRLWRRNRRRRPRARSLRSPSPRRCRTRVVREPDSEAERDQRAHADGDHHRSNQAEEKRNFARPVAPHCRELEDPGHDSPRQEDEGSRMWISSSQSYLVTRPKPTAARGLQSIGWTRPSGTCGC